ncbi:MAG: undecaprenyl/decaprenyl-phosphate alpha-N-acetylglucosaminyl 1-phosphate transferase [Candidatus Cloacimonetes bacterium]|nr:undecaprenyl/decaprenyl-phosphate alpha-N-acetylglucosaminyl 1-phosphate transferase [Candidatus Cloacimonadota bacterium]
MLYDNVMVLSLAFFFVLALTPFIIKLACVINFVDNPEARKVHKTATPLMGGLAVFLGFLLFSLYGVWVTAVRPIDLALLGYLAGAAVVVAVGLIDDRFGMKPLPKLLGQLTACALFLGSHWLHYPDFLELFGPVWLSLPVIALWMIGLMNALNFLDNMDGIISGMAGILALGFYAVSFMSKTPALASQSNFISLLSLTFAGAIFGFLPHNFRPAKIFLGDAGSMFVGYFLSTMGILLGRLAVTSRASKAYFLLPVLLLSFAIFDISLVSYTRRRDGRRVSQGGKDHSTHRIGTAMQSVTITALLVYLINAVIVITTILVFRTHSQPLLIMLTVIFAVLFLLFARKLDQIPIVVPQNQLKEPKA